MTLFGRRLPLMASFRRGGTTSPSKPVDPTASPAKSFVSSSESDGAFCVSYSESGGANCVSSGSYGASCISSLRCDGVSRVFSFGSGGTSRVFSSVSDGASRVFFSGSGGAFRVSSSQSDCASRVSCPGSSGASRAPSSGSGSAFCAPSWGIGGASCVPSSGPSGASCVSYLRSCDTAPAPAPVRRAAKPLLFRLVHLHPASRRGPHSQYRRCWSCQTCRSTARPAVLLPPASAPHRAPTGPSSRFPVPGPFFFVISSPRCMRTRCASILLRALATTTSKTY